MAKISYEELDQLTGDVLPERTVLGAVCSVSGGGSFTQSNSVAGSIGVLQAGINQCGLTNTATATNSISLPALTSLGL